MITEVKFIGITPFNLNKSLLPKIERFFEGSKKALIIRLSESSYSESFIKKVTDLSKKNQSIIIFNSRNSINNFSNINLTSKDLMRLEKKKNNGFILGASCHNQEEINKANELKCDYVLISPVLIDKNKNKKIGWKKFKELAKSFEGKSFPLGGVKEKDLEKSLAHNGAGISGISCFF